MENTLENNLIKPKMTGIELIAKERQEQIEKHGRTIQSDCEINANNELADVARHLMLSTPKMEGEPFKFHELKITLPDNWDENILKKMIDKPYRERLIIAGALIAAELDRLNSSQEAG